MFRSWFRGTLGVEKLFWWVYGSLEAHVHIPPLTVGHHNVVGWQQVLMYTRTLPTRNYLESSGWAAYMAAHLNSNFPHPTSPSKWLNLHSSLIGKLAQLSILNKTNTSLIDVIRVQGWKMNILIVFNASVWGDIHIRSITLLERFHFPPPPPKPNPLRCNNFYDTPF